MNNANSKTKQKKMQQKNSAKKKKTAITENKQK